MKLKLKGYQVSLIMGVKFQVTKFKVNGHFRSTNLDHNVCCGINIKNLTKV